MRVTDQEWRQSAEGEAAVEPRGIDPFRLLTARRKLRSRMAMFAIVAIALVVTMAIVCGALWLHNNVNLDGILKSPDG
jgi:hypothetical protein